MNTDLGDIVPSKGEEVLRRLKQAIITSVLPAGTAVTLQRLGQLVHANVTPVRDAVVVLVERGLMEKTGTGRYRITGISKNRIQAIMGIRLALESYAIETLIGNLKINKRNGHDLQAIKKKMQRIEDILQSNRWKDECLELDKEFHRMIVQKSGNAILTAIYDTRVSDLLEQLLKLVDHSVGDVKSSIQEHVEIVDAVLAKCLDKALAKLKQHFANSCNRIENGLTIGQSTEQRGYDV